jgi:hypothetical protein
MERGMLAINNEFSTPLILPLSLDKSCPHFSGTRNMPDHRAVHHEHSNQLRTTKPHLQNRVVPA